MTAMPESIQQVFVSHSSRDRDTAVRVCAVLDRLGVRCWLAEHNISPGEPFDEAILRGIGASQAFILLLSDAANASAHVKRELGLAVENGLAVYPIRIQEVQPGAKLQYLLQGTQWVDAWTPPLEAHLKRVAELIVGVTSDPVGVRSGSEPAPPQVPSSPVRTGYWLGWLAAAILLAVAVAGWLVLARCRQTGAAGQPDGRQRVAPIPPVAPSSAQRAPGVHPAKVPAAQDGGPWTNSLGLVFVPVTRTLVMFSIWDTRVQDYEAFVKESQRSWNRPSFQQGPTHPAVNLTWVDAKAFCAWMTQKERTAGILGTAREYRLPTDTEWSAAVGLAEETGVTPGDRQEDPRNSSTYPWGSSFPPPRGAGNYAPALQVDDFEMTSPVGSFAANRFGLYDMGGNVWQWCEDQRNPKRPFRVLRGGSWSAERAGGCPPATLSGFRGYELPNQSRETLGFRCVLTGTTSIEGSSAAGTGSGSKAMGPGS
jgi:hypothetical protein